MIVQRFAPISLCEQRSIIVPTIFDKELIIQALFHQSVFFQWLDNYGHKAKVTVPHYNS